MSSRSAPRLSASFVAIVVAGSRRGPRAHCFRIGRDPGVDYSPRTTARAPASIQTAPRPCLRRGCGRAPRSTAASGRSRSSTGPTSTSPRKNHSIYAIEASTGAIPLASAPRHPEYRAQNWNAATLNRRSTITEHTRDSPRDQHDLRRHRQRDRRRHPSLARRTRHEHRCYAPDFPIAVDRPLPAGGDAAHQLQRACLALDGNEIVIGYGDGRRAAGTDLGLASGGAQERRSARPTTSRSKRRAGITAARSGASGMRPQSTRVETSTPQQGMATRAEHSTHSESVLRLELQPYASSNTGRPRNGSNSMNTTATSASATRWPT